MQTDQQTVRRWPAEARLRVLNAFVACWSIISLRRRFSLVDSRLFWPNQLSSGTGPGPASSTHAAVRPVLLTRRRVHPSPSLSVMHYSHHSGDRRRRATCYLSSDINPDSTRRCHCHCHCPTPIFIHVTFLASVTVLMRCWDDGYINKQYFCFITFFANRLRLQAPARLRQALLFLH